MAIRLTQAEARRLGGWKTVMRSMGDITCSKCGKTEPRRGVKQKLCVACAEEADKARKLEWQRKHPREPRDKLHARQLRERDRRVERGATRSKRRAQGEALLPDRSERPLCLRFVMPFVQHLSKNALPALITKHGKPATIVQEEIVELRNRFAWEVQAALAALGAKWPKSKTWVDFVVQKPNHRSDAVNVIDTLCDALKVGLGVDDRWFAIGLLDWEIVKAEPQVFVQVSTEATEEMTNCTFCGLLAPASEFRGHKRVCPECANDGKLEPCPSPL